MTRRLLFFGWRVRIAGIPVRFAFCNHFEAKEQQTIQSLMGMIVMAHMHAHYRQMEANDR